MTTAAANTMKARAAQALGKMDILGYLHAVSVLAESQFHTVTIDRDGVFFWVLQPKLSNHGTYGINYERLKETGDRDFGAPPKAVRFTDVFGYPSDWSAEYDMHERMMAWVKKHSLTAMHPIKPINWWKLENMTEVR